MERMDEFVRMLDVAERVYVNRVGPIDERARKAIGAAFLKIYMDFDEAGIPDATRAAELYVSHGIKSLRSELTGEKIA